MAPGHAATLLLSNAGQMPETSRVEGLSGKGAFIWSTAELLRGDPKAFYYGEGMAVAELEQPKAAETAFEAIRQWQKEQG